MHRLSKDTRFTLEFDYQADFIPNACKVVIHDDALTIEEIAAMMYGVAAHGVIYEGRYIAGSAEDRDKHRK